MFISFQFHMLIMNITGSPMVLRRFQIDETGTSGANVWIEARQPGLVSFLLTLVGLDPNSSLRVTRGSISFRNSSVFGMNQVSTPLANVGAFVGGYKKPFWALVFSGLMVLIGLSLAFTEDGGMLFGFFSFLAIVGLVYYYLQKTMFMGFETSGGGTYGFAFKASVLEGVGVDIKRVESTIAFVNTLISSASLGEAFVEQHQTTILGGRQATMLADAAPEPTTITVQAPAQPAQPIAASPQPAEPNAAFSQPTAPPVDVPQTVQATQPVVPQATVQQQPVVPQPATVPTENDASTPWPPV